MARVGHGRAIGRAGPWSRKLGTRGDVVISSVARARRSAPKLVGIGTAAVLAVGVAMVGVSAATSPPVTFKACLGGGALYHVTTGAVPTCKSGDRRVTWNQTGPRGPQGVTGAT